MVVREQIWGWGTQEGGKEEHRLSLSVFGRMLVDIKLTRKECLVRRGNDGQRKQLQTYRTCFKTWKSLIIYHRNKQQGKSK